MSNAPHDIAGWARLLVADRDHLLRQPYPAAFAREMVDRAVLVYDGHWRPRMRYRSTDVRQASAGAVRSVAEWFEANYHKL